MFEPETHFRNFLGPPGTSVCGSGDPRFPEERLTLIPADVTCERCLARLGRLRQADFGPPTPPTQSKRGK